jgi:flagellar biogenesis protein FliO
MAGPGESKIKGKSRSQTASGGGWVGWLLQRLQFRVAAGARPRPGLEMVQRITLAPRQSLALVEADGRRLLVATSPDGAPAFYALDERPGAARASRVTRTRVPGRVCARVSW